jgi:phospholipase C
VHRFYQMWQQLDCNANNATDDNPSGCSSDLFPWVETTVGAGANGIKQPANFSTEYSSTAATTGEGSTAMGFYNVQNGDVPYFEQLADQYSMSDDFHQSVNGGTGANHIMLGHGDMIWFSDGKGHSAVPPHNTLVAGGTANGGIVDEVENPNPAAKTNNWYTEDGYGGGSFGSASYGGGSYSNCADLSQPGVAPIVNYLHSLEPKIHSNCEVHHYYLLNNYNPGYFGNGNNAYTDTNKTIPSSPSHHLLFAALATS